MYPRIIFPLDSSDLAERVLPLVSLLGRSFNSSVELLSVIQEIPGYVAPQVNSVVAGPYATSSRGNFEASATTGSSGRLFWLTSIVGNSVQITLCSPSVRTGQRNAAKGSSYLHNDSGHRRQEGE